jgi:hypothetical protein
MLSKFAAWQPPLHVGVCARFEVRSRLPRDRFAIRSRRGGGPVRRFRALMEEIRKIAEAGRREQQPIPRVHWRIGVVREFPDALATAPYLVVRKPSCLNFVHQLGRHLAQIEHPHVPVGTRWNSQDTMRVATPIGEIQRATHNQCKQNYYHADADLAMGTAPTLPEACMLCSFFVRSPSARTHAKLRTRHR